MTSGGPPASYGQGQGGPNPAGPDQTFGRAAMQPGPWTGGYGPPPPQPRRGGKLTGIGVAVAIVLSAAALVVGVVSLVRQPNVSVASTPTSAPLTSPAGDTTAADKALCEEVGPLLAESDRISNDYVDLGQAGSPERDAALPKFRADTTDWAKRTQTILDDHPEVQLLFKNSLQRFVEDRQLFVAGIRQGALKSYDQAIWSDSLAAYAGPLSICGALGVTW